MWGFLERCSLVFLSLPPIHAGGDLLLMDDCVLLANVYFSVEMGEGGHYQVWF